MTSFTLGPSEFSTAAEARARSFWLLNVLVECGWPAWAARVYCEVTP